MSLALKIFTLMTRKCNYSCGHCSSYMPPHANSDMDLEDAVEAIKGFLDVEGKRVHTVSGGEPSLHEGMPELLKSSQDLGYKTVVVTNGHWIDIRDIGLTEEYLIRHFPEGVAITCSFDLQHIQQCPDLIKRIQLLKQITKGRNPINTDGAYNGLKERKRLRRYQRHVGNTFLIPMQNMGRARGVENHNRLNTEDLNCPKNGSNGFVLTKEGVYYCLRAALNKNPHLMVARTFDRPTIEAGLERISKDSINLGIAQAYRPKSTYNHICDVCEAALPTKF